MVLLAQGPLPLAAVDCWHAIQGSWACSALGAMRRPWKAPAPPRAAVVDALPDHGAVCVPLSVVVPGPV